MGKTVTDSPQYLLHGTGPLGPLLRPSDVRIGLVSTLRDVEDQFLQWLEWFRLIGFAHVFLYFDDPSYDEAAIATARSTYSGEFVSFALNTPELRKEWMTLKTWSKFSPFTDDRMCRQLLNIAHALKRAGQTEQAAESVDWMFHLDHDELFLPPPQGLQAHFKHLEAGNCRLCLYQNFEAAPQDHTLTPFLDVNLFKIPSGRVSKTPLGAAGMNFWAQRTKARNYFLYYDNGKSAVRVKKHKDIAPTSVHLLYPPDELEDFITGKKGWTTFPDHELADMNLTWMSSCHEEIVVSAKVLHYPATHFDRLWRKYKHLGNFPAVRFGGELVVPASFHLEARDEFLKHRDEKIQQQKLKELLEHAAFLRSEEEVQSQLETGSIVVIDTVRDTLQRGCWTPPRLLRPSLYTLLQRRPSKEDMLRMQKMKRVPAEVLFSEGLLKNLDPGLDQVVQHLDSKGWVACNLGLHVELLERALLEAKRLKPRMTPGSTVIENQILDPTLPNADRGDHILFMQEQGLSGPTAAKGPTPTLTLLETALTDLGMQLDLRLQRSNVRLRITERCDGMLACYEAGGAYSAHIDNADGDGRVDGRVLTMVLYLNVNWDRSAGGELAIFEAEQGDIGDSNVKGTWRVVYPEAGTLVLLRADHVLHEVRSAHEERYALSMWFCGQHVEYGGS